MPNYSDAFYADRNAKTRYSAQAILSIVSEVVPAVQSAVDLGCGVGTFLSVLKDRGATDILGMDGAWVKPAYLVIPQECFQQWDLAKPVEVGRRFDLAISLEVAEHLPADSATGFVAALVGLSDVVLFSAAIPDQGGVDHVNEQWPDYSARCFGQQGYGCLDILRMRIWDDRQIPYWYRQNVLLFVKNEKMSLLRLSPDAVLSAARMPPSLVHPELFVARLAPPGVRKSFESLVQATLQGLRRRLVGKRH